MTADHLPVDAATHTELSDRVKRYLSLQHFPGMRRLEVSVFEDTVVLDGCIPSFHERQLAVAFCMRVAGVHKVIDRLIVSDLVVHGQRGERESADAKRRSRMKSIVRIADRLPRGRTSMRSGMPFAGNKRIALGRRSPTVLLEDERCCAQTFLNAAALTAMAVSLPVCAADEHAEHATKCA